MYGITTQGEAPVPALPPIEAPQPKHAETAPIGITHQHPPQLPLQLLSALQPPSAHHTLPMQMVLLEHSYIGNRLLRFAKARPRTVVRFMHLRVQATKMSLQMKTAMLLVMVTSMLQVRFPADAVEAAHEDGIAFDSHTIRGRNALIACGRRTMAFR